MGHMKQKFEEKQAQVECPDCSAVLNQDEERGTFTCPGCVAEFEHQASCGHPTNAEGDVCPGCLKSQVGAERT